MSPPFFFPRGPCLCSSAQLIPSSATCSSRNKWAVADNKSRVIFLSHTQLRVATLDLVLNTYGLPCLFMQHTLHKWNIYPSFFFCGLGLEIGLDCCCFFMFFLISFHCPIMATKCLQLKFMSKLIRLFGMGFILKDPKWMIPHKNVQYRMFQTDIPVGSNPALVKVTVA